MAAKKYKFPFGQVSQKQVKPDEGSTCLIYYGGKSRDADWVIGNLPPGYTTFVDVFGGGGAITFRLADKLFRRMRALDQDVLDTSMGGRVIVYNDIGNVVNFMRMLRDYGEQLYMKLYLTPFSREEFVYCSQNWRKMQLQAYESGSVDDYIEWARQWFVVINQGYSHAESETSWHVAKVVNSARALANHTDDLGYLTECMRYIHIEKLDFARIIKLYDKRTTCFYADPPYVDDSRVSLGTYENELPVERHRELAQLLSNCQGQAVVSGYHSALYDEIFKDWRRVEKTAKSAIQNSAQLKDRGERTEVLWLREHDHGLWSQT